MLVESLANRQVLYVSFLLVSGLLILWSRHQPFPQIPRRLGWITVVFLFFLLLSDTAPRPMRLNVILVLSLVYASLGLWVGLYHLLNSRRDVLTAPLFGFLFCLFITAIVVQMWDDLQPIEHWAGFIGLGILYCGETWLVFRGLLIGRLPLAWSQAGFFALSQGRLFGHHGAIECFEKAWDAEEEHLNPMAYYALMRIHQSLNHLEEMLKWKDLLELSGGTDAIDSTWIDAINEFTDPLTMSFGKQSSEE